MIIGEKASKKGVVVHKDPETTAGMFSDDIVLNLYQRIEKSYGRERIVPTIYLLLAAKECGVVEGDILRYVPITYKGEVALCSDGNNILYREITPKVLFSPNLETYAIESGHIKLKWKESTKMLAIFINLCMGNGWYVDFSSEDNCYKILYGDEQNLIYRDFWRDSFVNNKGEKIREIGNAFNQCKANCLSIRNIKRLLDIQNKAGEYYGKYCHICVLAKKIHNLQQI